MKVILSIAGSDSSGGAGLQADIKTAEAFGVFCTTAVTVLTAQNTTGVSALLPSTPEFLAEQLRMVSSDFEIAAVKIGMLLNKELICVVKEFIKELNTPIVLDPVFISKAKSKLLDDDSVEELKTLFEFVTLITPNQFEAKALFGESLHINAPATVLIKNFNTIHESLDTLYFPNGDKKEFVSPLLNTTNLHGSGCALSTAIACNLALGKRLEDAVKISCDYVYSAILHAPNLGHGMGPLNHKRGFDA